MIKNSTSEKNQKKKKKLNVETWRTQNIKNQIGRTKFVFLNPFIKIFYLNTDCLYNLFQI